MYIHNEIQLAVIPLLKKYDLELIDLIGLMNQAAWELCELSQPGIEKRYAELMVQLDEEKPTNPVDDFIQRQVDEDR